MHIAEIVDVGDVDTGGIAAPSDQFRAQARHRMGHVTFGPLQQVDRVRIVIAGDDLHLASRLRPAPGALDHHVHGLPRGLPGRIGAAVLVAAAGIDQVREIEFREAFALDEVEQARQLGGVVLGHGEADADLDAAVAQQS